MKKGSCPYVCVSKGKYHLPYEGPLPCISKHEGWSKDEHLHKGWAIFGNEHCRWVKKGKDE